MLTQNVYIADDVTVLYSTRWKIMYVNPWEFYAILGESFLLLSS